MLARDIPDDDDNDQPHLPLQKESTQSPHGKNAQREKIQKIINSMITARKLDALLNEEVYEGDGCKVPAHENETELGNNAPVNHDKEFGSEWKESKYNDSNSGLAQPKDETHHFESFNAQQGLPAARAVRNNNHVTPFKNQQSETPDIDLSASDEEFSATTTPLDEDSLTIKDVLVEVLLKAATIAANEVAASQHAASVADSIMSKYKEGISLSATEESTLASKSLVEKKEDYKDGEQEIVHGKKVSTPTPHDKLQRPLLEEVLMSAFEPGINPRVQMFVNFVFMVLFMTLATLAVFTGGNLHVIAMFLISVMLFATVQWFVREALTGDNET